MLGEDTGVFGHLGINTSVKATSFTPSWFNCCWQINYVASGTKTSVQIQITPFWYSARGSFHWTVLVNIKNGN